MLNRSNLHAYQEHTIDFVLNNKSCGIFLDLGLGKTISTLTAIDQLMFVDFEVNKTLVIAPKRVAQDTWSREVEDWAHVKHLKLSLVLGTERQRKEALLKKADIYVINRENVVWLVAHYGTAWPFDMMIIDELSSFKSAKSHRFKALRSVRPRINRVVGLTGTPAPNSLLDLWPQLYLLDQGERLGKTLTGYRDKYFNPGRRNGHIVFNYDLKKDADYEKQIYDKIGDICISMKAKDYLDLPGKIETNIPVKLSDKNMKNYLEFEKKQILALEDAEDISAINAAALGLKLWQYANGAIYTDDKKSFYEVHNEKIEALEEIIDVANGKPVLVFYWFDHDRVRLLKYLKKYKPETLEGPEHIRRWNQKKVPLLLCQPMSAGHGLNMQGGGNLIEWFCLPNWSSEYYNQANGRLDRQGQQEVVSINRLLTEGTVDFDMLNAIERKMSKEAALMEAVKARIKKYIK